MERGVVEVSVPAESAHLYAAALRRMPVRGESVRVFDVEHDAEDDPFTREAYEAALRRVAGPPRRGPEPDLEKRELAAELRHGRRLTMREVGERLGVSRQRAYQLLGEAPPRMSKGTFVPPVDRRRGRAKGDAEARQVAEARAKATAGEDLTRDERHLLQRDYRRREREGA